ncbi:hypothetical protein [Lamprocystis purpurea]|uniref:hypothetical protein n=1 Tax=Lamprocystis purpurea TaxID=61598 RepID=UPI00037FDF46|nr:hypothetical protein [Lamprocystis purpurea]
MSLIHTAELHQVEPFNDLVALLRHAAAVALDPPAWMPWNYTTALARLSADPAPHRTDPAPSARRAPTAPCHAPAQPRRGAGGC